MKFIHIVTCACVVFSTGTFASEEIAFLVDTALLERNISSCREDIRNTKQADIDMLKQNPVEDFKVRLAGAFMTRYVQFSNNRACSIGLLDNAILILESYLQSSSEPSFVKNDLAEAKLKRASFLPKEARTSYYRDADNLIQQYIVSPDETVAPPFYLASHSYISAAELTNDDEKIVLLDKAIAIAQSGRNAEISEAKKQQLTEPLGIALGNKAKYYKEKDEGQFRKSIEESMQYLMEGFASGDKLSAYNLAVNYSLLSDAENSKKWLLVIEERKAADKQICLHGLLGDPDLDWLRKNQKEWLASYFRRNCSSFMP